MKPTLSFAQILEEKLAEATSDTISDDSAGASAPIGIEADRRPLLPPDTFTFDWSALVKAKLQSAYQGSAPPHITRRTTRADKPLADSPRPTSEPEWQVEQLSTGARLALEKLYIDGPLVSRTMVKRAYRRLAKRLHPDVIEATAKIRSEAFLLVQEAYDIVTRELEQLERAKAAA